jgi:hypothetical protein
MTSSLSTLLRMGPSFPMSCVMWRSAWSTLASAAVCRESVPPVGGYQESRRDGQGGSCSYCAGILSRIDIVDMRSYGRHRVDRLDRSRDRSTPGRRGEAYGHRRTERLETGLNDLWVVTDVFVKARGLVKKEGFISPCE